MGTGERLMRLLEYRGGAVVGGTIVAEKLALSFVRRGAVTFASSE